MLLRIGLTGGIASGKTTVATLFASHAINIIDADIIAKQLTAQQSVLAQIQALFGGSIVTADGELNRKALRQLIFADINKRQQLENLLHPLIRKKMQTELTKATSPYTIAVIPLLAESTGIDFIDRVLVVDVPEAVQLQRLIERDQISEPQAKAMLGAQASRKQRLAIADDIIDNQTNLQSLQQRVSALHQQYLQLVTR